MRRFTPYPTVIPNGVVYVVTNDGSSIVIRDVTNGVDIAKLSKDIITMLTLVALQYSDPSLRLSGTETNARTFDLKESGGLLNIVNVTDNVTEVSLDPTNNLIRFTRRIFGEKVWGIESSSVSLTLGTGGTAGPESTLLDISNDDNLRFLLPLVALLSIGGTVGTGETVTVEVYAYDDAGNKYGPIMSLSKTGSTGSEYVPIDLSKLTLGSDRRIVKVTATAYSSATSTSATASAQVWCLKF